jgi:predicted TIM-barrel fold metal-dependent hydrolase
VHLEYQAALDSAKVRKFLLKYQDRILYGSDVNYGPADNDPEPVAQLHNGWLEDWHFLVTSDRMQSADFEQPFRGLHLPKEVVDKIYQRNAQKMFAGAWGDIKK